MDYESMSIMELKNECKKRSIKNLSKKNKKDLIFTLKCNDTFGFKNAVNEPGCSWERALEIDPQLSNVKSFEKLLIILDGIKSTTNKKSKFKTNKKVFYFEDLFSFQPFFETNSTQLLIQENQEELEKFELDLNYEYDTIDLKNIDLNILIELGKNYVSELKNKFAFNYELLHKIVPYLEELNSYIGWDDVKNKIVSIIIPLLLNLNEETDLIHTVIMGPPGVGKTSLGLILSKIYSKCGLIKNPTGKFNIFRKSDLIGEYLGQTAIKTQKAIDSSIGGVMFIDEAYSLGVINQEGNNPSYAKECLDTLNQNLTENVGKFICIIAGYEDLLKKQFFSLNYGLERRFPIIFNIKNYSSNELSQIFMKKILEQNYEINIDKNTIDKFIEKHYKEFKFYAGDIDTLIPFIKRHHAMSIFGKSVTLRKKFTMENLNDGINDFIANRQREEEKESNISYMAMFL